MEPIYLPDIYKMKDFTTTSMDSIDSLSRKFEKHVNTETSKDTEAGQSREIKYAVRKLVNFPTFYNLEKVNEIIDLVKQAIFTTLGSDDVEKLLGAKESLGQKVLKRISKLAPRKKGMVSNQTFNDQTIIKYNVIKAEMQKETKKNAKLVKQFKTQEKRHWSAEDSVKKYELCLYTAMTSRTNLEDSLSEKELMARSKAIKQLANTLGKRQKKAIEIRIRYDELKAGELATRRSLKHLEEAMIEDIKCSLTKTIRDILSTIKSILVSNTSILENTKTLEILTKVENYNYSSTTEDIINSFKTELV